MFDESVANFNARQASRVSSSAERDAVGFIGLSFFTLLLAGCIVAPVGVIHGVGVWLGVF